MGGGDVLEGKEGRVCGGIERKMRLVNAVNIKYIWHISDYE